MASLFPEDDETRQRLLELGWRFSRVYINHAKKIKRTEEVNAKCIWR